MHQINPVFRPAFKTGLRYRLLYGGAGSSKSVTVAQDMIRRCVADGRHRILVLRKIARTCRLSCFKLFKDVLRAMGRLQDVRINHTDMNIVFPNGAEILHEGLDDVEKLKSITGVTHVWVEEATEMDFPESEMEEVDLSQVDLRVRGVDADLKPSITLTFNPVYSAKKIFEYFSVPTSDLPSRSHRVYDDVYVQHTTHEDNPWVGDGYTNVFTRLGGAMEAAYTRGELVIIDNPDQVIPYRLIKQAKDTEPVEGVQYLAADVARFGDDDTVVGLLRGNALRSLEHLEGQDTTSLGRTIASRCRKLGVSAEHTGVDAVGIGAGVIDAMHADDFPAVEIVSGGKPVRPKERSASATRSEDLRFKNLRSQMWWTLRDAMEAGTISLAAHSTQRLVEDLCAPRYRIGSDKVVEVEPKRGTRSWGVKARLGRSPDDGDTLVYAVAMRDLKIKSYTDYSRVF